MRFDWLATALPAVTSIADFSGWQARTLTVNIATGANNGDVRSPTVQLARKNRSVVHDAANLTNS
jgi:hypothetical protein